MFAKTDNPSDSNISHKYIDAVQEAAQDSIQWSIENDDGQWFTSGIY